MAFLKVLKEITELTDIVFVQVEIPVPPTLANTVDGVSVHAAIVIRVNAGMGSVGNTVRKVCFRLSSLIDMFHNQSSCSDVYSAHYIYVSHIIC